MIDRYYKEPRKRMRLEGYDYSLEGAFFLTICTKGRDTLFDSEPVIRMLEKYWEKIAEKFPGTILDEFVVMPNHIHGIHFCVDADRPVGDDHVGADPCVGPSSKTIGPSSTSEFNDKEGLPRVVQWYKTMTTNAYLAGIKEHGWKPFIGKLWQRGYHEKIVRDEEELNIFKKYVIDNPLNWDRDEENIIKQGQHATKR